MNTLNLDIRKTRILTNRLFFFLYSASTNKTTLLPQVLSFVDSWQRPRASAKKPASIFQIDNSEL